MSGIPGVALGLCAGATIAAGAAGYGVAKTEDAANPDLKLAPALGGSVAALGLGGGALASAASHGATGNALAGVTALGLGGILVGSQLGKLIGGGL